MTRLVYNGLGLNFGGATINFPNTPQTVNDWFLPSDAELDQMYYNLVQHGVGNFSESYWASSENFDEEEPDPTKALLTYMTGVNAGLSLFISKGGSYSVRACRTFTDSIGAYSLRDTGPAGGLIFYVNGTTYYEAPLIDQGTSVWSNITNSASGAIGRAIGDGQQNTLDIIGQPGHITSAAKLCDDLEYDPSTEPTEPTGPPG